MGSAKDMVEQLLGEEAEPPATPTREQARKMAYDAGCETTSPDFTLGYFVRRDIPPDDPHPDDGWIWGLMRYDRETNTWSVKDVNSTIPIEALSEKDRDNALEALYDAASAR